MVKKLKAGSNRLRIVLAWISSIVSEIMDAVSGLFLKFSKHIG